MKLSIGRAVLAIGLFVSPVGAQTEIVLNGLPTLRVSENGVVRTVEDIAPEDAAVEECLLQRFGTPY